MSDRNSDSKKHTLDGYNSIVPTSDCTSLMVATRRERPSNVRPSASAPTLGMRYSIQDIDDDSSDDEYESPYASQIPTVTENSADKPYKPEPATIEPVAEDPDAQHYPILDFPDSSSEHDSEPEPDANPDPKTESQSDVIAAHTGEITGMACGYIDDPKFELGATR